MNVKYLVVHCSDSPDDIDVTAQDIHQWHLENDGWSGIGYHRIIQRDGTVEHGRPDYWQGAHVAGHNHASLGVCLVGRRRFTQRQMESLRTVLEGWLVTHPQARICGHRDLDPGKTCPNFDVNTWYNHPLVAKV